jgi:predicted ATPase/signal transduction histidine kinase/CheY-like chemotaxis protein
MNIKTHLLEGKETKAKKAFRFTQRQYIHSSYQQEHKQQKEMSIGVYRLIETIHEGKHCEIHRSISTTTQNPVVIKSLVNCHSKRHVSKLRREYEIGKLLDNCSHVVRYIDFIEEVNQIGIVLEDDKSCSLASIIPQNGFEVGQFLDYAVQLAAGLVEIHSRHVIHKDIKPDNVIVDTKGKLKYIDFGCSSRLREENLTMASRVEGTLTYISPEQTGRINRFLDYRSDFYSLGVTLYHLLTGSVPFITKNEIELIHCHIAHEPIPPHELVQKIRGETIPITISNIIMKLLRKNVEDRYQSAGQGLLYDMNKCREEYLATGTVRPFLIAQTDVSERFIIPNKLYGREKEATILLNTFERVSEQGRPEMLAVTGYSGVGKSSLINEIQKPVAFHNGYFLSGKFDQLNRNVAYSAIAEAFQMLIKQILSEKEESIQQWKSKILSALGSNAQVVVDVIPELENLIGKQQPVSDLGSMESKNRFHLVFSKFIQVFTLRNPIVLFLDDTQWIDNASLNLIQIFIQNPDIKYLMLICAYRATEVFDSHPMIVAIDEWKQSGVRCNEIVLSPLSFSTVHKWITDTLAPDSPDITLQLAELVASKTGGNPFFVRVFLTALYEEQLIYHYSGRWHWRSIELIRLHRATDNIVDLMINKMNQFPKATKKILQIASCLGNSFVLSRLEMVANKKDESLMSDLYPVLNSSLGHILDDEFHFAHDKIQEAALDSLSTEKKAAIHWRIGTMLLDQQCPLTSRSSANDKDVFEIVDHLNKGRYVLEQETNETKKKEWNLLLTQLNLTAGERARKAIAYLAAEAYLELAVQYLDSMYDTETVWANHHDLAFNVYTELANIKHLTGDYDTSNQIGDSLLGRARSAIEKARIYTLRIAQQTLRTQSMEAIQTGKEALQWFGLDLPIIVTDILPAVMREHAQIERYVAKYRSPQEQTINIQSLMNSFSKMEDEDMIIASQILASLMPSSYIANPMIYFIVVSMAVRLLLQFGLTSDAPVCFACFGSVLCAQDQICTGYSFGQLAIELNDRMGNPAQKSKVFTGFGIFNIHWFKDVRNAIGYAKSGWRAGLEGGEFQFAGYSRMYLNTTQFLCGELIKDVLKNSIKTNEFAHNFKNQIVIDTTNCLKLVCNELQAEIEVIGSEEEQQMLDAWRQRDNYYTIAHYYLFKAMEHYMFDKDNEKAYNYIIEAEKHATSLNPQYSYVHFVFFYALILARKMRQMIATKTFDEILMAQLREKLQLFKDKLHTWSEYCPTNYHHKYLLVAAEMKRLNDEDNDSDDEDDVSDLYEQAIDETERNRFVMEYALAAELTAQYWLDHKKKRIARMYMQQAHQGYKSWGAKRKVYLLESKYSSLLFGKGVISAAKTRSLPLFDSEPSSTVTLSSALLDLQSVIKASQVISSTIEISKLLYNIMKIIVETAGATFGAILLDGVVEAEYIQSQYVQSNASSCVGKIDTLCAVPVEQWHNGCREIIDYVTRTSESVVLRNACEDKQFENNEYCLKNKCKSILCMPVTQGNELKAVLYVENRMLTDAFTDQRVQVLSILTSQMAISLANAKYFQAQLQAAEHIAEIQRGRAQEAEHYRKKQEDFIDRICHEIRNPLNGIYGNLELMKTSVETIDHKTNEDSKADQEIVEHFRHLHDGINAIESCVKHQKVITDDVLTLSRLESNLFKLNIAPFRPNKVIQSVIQMYEREIKDKNLVLTTMLLDNNAILCGDSARIAQVLINLFSNAVKFASKAHNDMSGKGRIMIRTSVTTSSLLTIEIEDNGIGMTQEEMRHIFNRFEQANQRTFSEYGGSGLGLYISKHLVELMGGQISVDSEKFVRTKFTFTVQCTPYVSELTIISQPILLSHHHHSRSESLDSPISAPTPCCGTEENNKKDMKILIVEDNLINQRVLTKLLKIMGHTCLVANNGQEAVEMYNKYWNDLSLIFMDVVMPICDGCVATQQIREDEKKRISENPYHPPITIVGLSGNARKEHIEKAKTAGMTCYLTKPVRKEEVYNIVNQYCPPCDHK